MRIDSLSLRKIRSFDRVDLSFSPAINVFIGPNNSGKSTLLRAILGVQYGPMFSTDDLRMPVGSDVFITLVCSPPFPLPVVGTSQLTIEWRGEQQLKLSTNQMNQIYGVPCFEATAPRNAIYPFLSKRKVAGYSDVVNESESLGVRLNMENLSAKIDRVATAEMPSAAKFRAACEDILGVRISAIASGGGKKAVLIVDDFRSIPLIAMGEGVASACALLADLCVAKDKVFIVEELENDLHPKALKKLLSLIKISSQENGNQFLISTHSNIVVRQLCAEQDCNLFEVQMRLDGLEPRSTVAPIGHKDASERRRVLEDLGYDLFDMDLYSAWIFFEESSAEQIVRELLIPWFVPQLSGRLRTFAAGGVDQIEVKFSDFDRLFVYLNLEATYKNRAWVLVDAGEHEAEVLAKLREKWTARGWLASQFQQLAQHEFENYYPASFKSQVELILAAPTQDRRSMKQELLKAVLDWSHANPDEAKRSFRDSAGEIVTFLQKVAAQI